MFQAKSEGRKEITARYPADEIRAIEAENLKRPDDRPNPQWLSLSNISIVDARHHGSSTQLSVKFDETDWICPGMTFTGCSIPPSYGTNWESSDMYHRLSFEKTKADKSNPTGLRLIRDEQFDPQIDVDDGQSTCPVPWYDVWDQTARLFE